MKRLQPRKNERVSHLRDVTCRVPASGRVLRGNTIDLSVDGAKLFTLLALRTGDRVELVWEGTQPPVTVGGHVVHVQVNEEGAWAGVDFFQPMEPAVYDRLRGKRGRERLA
ncbi:MAG: PilZ domain-containing protein [Isosphaeraceae bacterium]